MQTDRHRFLHFQERAFGTAGQPPSLWRKAVALVATVGLVGVALMFSVVLFAVVLTVGVAAWGYFWWKTRDLRRQMREQGGPAAWAAARAAQREGGLVLEGEVIREVDPAREPGNESRRDA